MSPLLQQLIDALKCRAGVMNGSTRFRDTVLAKDAKIRPFEFSGMPGFMVREGKKEWWVPVGNVVDVRFREQKEVN